jgi:acetyl esterase/lipase
MFTIKNTVNEILANSGPELSLFFSQEILRIIPEEYRDRTMQELSETLTMPWGAPLPADDLVSEANMAAQGDKLWDLIPLWNSNLTIDSNDLNSVCLMRLKNMPEGLRPAVIICPGGGYEFLSFDYEGIQIARRMEEAGFRAFILNYRVSPNHYPAPQLDLICAIRHVRANAEKYQIRKDDLMVLGFSAGGHLCASAAALSDKLEAKYAEEAARLLPEDVKAYCAESAIPDKICLCYPVISFLTEQHEPSFIALSGGDETLRGKLSVETLITDTYPKTFLWTCADDFLVPPSNAKRMALALENSHVSHRFIMYPQGGHGCSLGIGTSAEGWVDEMLRYMQPE